MKYELKSFTVPASSGGTCDERTGHMEPDYHGKCLRCGVRLEAPSQALRDHAERIGGTVVSMTKTYRIGTPCE